MTSQQDEIRALLDHFTSHYEPWMDSHPPESQSCTFSRHTLGTLKRARELLAETPAETKTAALPGWVVASGGRGHYRSWGDSGPEWTTDIDLALRFARRIDADRFSAEDPDAWAVLSVDTPDEDSARAVLRRIHAEVFEMMAVAASQPNKVVAFHVEAWAETLGKILSSEPHTPAGFQPSDSAADLLERQGVLGPLMQELDYMERAAAKCDFLTGEHLRSWATQIRGVVTGAGLPRNCVLPGPAGVSVLAIRELLNDLAGHQGLDEHAQHVLVESGHLLTEYRDEVCEMLAARPGQWSAWSETETDSDPGDPLCGHAEVWRVGWWQGSLGDPDMVIRARNEAEARALSAELNRILIPRSHSQEPWSESLELSEEARGLCYSDTALSSLLYDLDLLPEQLAAQEERTPGLVKAFHRLYGVLYAWQARDLSKTGSDEAVLLHHGRVLEVLAGHHYATGTVTFNTNGVQMRDSDGNKEFVAVPVLQAGHRALVAKIEALLDEPEGTPAPTSGLTDEEIQVVREMIRRSNIGC